MIIPLTMISSNPDENASLIAFSHVKSMYVNGLEQLSQLRNSLTSNPYIQSVSIGYVKSIVHRWLGSEKLLYNLVANLGERLDKTVHVEYEEFYQDLGGIVPNWFTCENAVQRHLAELMFWDDINRLNNRCIIKRLSGGLADNRQHVNDETVKTELDYLAQYYLDRAQYHGYCPQTFNTDTIKSLILHFYLYEQSISTFFRRNKYYSLLPDYRSLDNKPNIQRVASETKIESVLRGRRDDIRRRSQPSQEEAVVPRNYMARNSDWMVSFTAPTSTIDYSNLAQEFARNANVGNINENE